MIQMTRDQYNRKYGVAPTVSEPIKMTRAQYQAKYGQEPKQQEDRTLGGFAGNVVKSAGKNALGIGESLLNVANPDMDKNTIANVGRLVQGGLQKIDPTEGKVIANAIGDSTPIKHIKQIDSMRGRSTDYTPQADAVGEFYKDRYGGVENIKRSAYEDPVGVALDVSTVLSGVGGGLKGLGSLSGSSKLAKAGQIASTVGKVTDPLAIAGKGLGKAGGVVAEKVGKTLPKNLRADIARGALDKATKASKSQYERYSEVAGKGADLTSDMLKEKIYDLKDINRKIAKPQKAYNALTRTSDIVSGKDFAFIIRQRIKDILRNNASDDAYRFAEALEDQAKHYEKLDNMTREQFTNAKSSSFGNTSNAAMTNPYAMSVKKEIAELQLKALDSMAPGSAKLGKKLQRYRTMKDIFEEQRDLGRGSQFFNIHKPAMAGMLSGAGAGAGVGSIVPVVGTATGAGLGALIGGASSVLANSRSAQRSLAMFLNENKKVPNIFQETLNSIGKGAKKSYNTGKAIRMFNPE